MTHVRSRKFTFTDFDISHYNGEYYSTNNPECDYIFAGRETCPTTKRPHLQGFVYFRHARSVRSVRKLFKPCHVEVIRGSFEQNEKYCSKEGDWYESGERPKTALEKGHTEQQRWKRIKDLAKAGDLKTLEDEEPRVWLRDHDLLHRIALKYASPPAILSQLKNGYIYGNPGIGKTRWVREFFGVTRVFSKAGDTKWWDGYNGEPVVIIDDLEPRDAERVGFLNYKQWCHEYPFSAEIKGGTICIRPRCVIITSNYPFSSIFGRDQSLFDAMSRRLRKFDINVDSSTGFGDFSLVSDYFKDFLE